MPLVIYKSSAGSGKTTTLVNEYLNITLKEPAEFRHVLAITFTNKAANEMKERILSALEEIIDGRAWEMGEYKTLIRDLKMEKTELQTRAGRLQYLILHHYDEFSVSTIDSFVHKIIRTFANDVKLPQNFEVVIDSDDIIPDIVNELFGKVGVEKALTDIMVQFVMTQTDDEKSYDLGREIKKFTQEQMGEDGFTYLQKIEQFDAVQMLEIINDLFAALKKQKQKIISEAKEALKLIYSAGLDGSEFSGGNNGIGGYFKKAAVFENNKPPSGLLTPEKTVNDNNWYAKSKSSDVKQLIDQIKNELSDKYQQIKKDIEHFYYLKFISQKIYALALTNEIRKIFEDYTDRTQKVHISEFNKRISKEIADQPIPFIYERLGRRYKYFLVDEFQDTSILQWNNLLPLIDESLSNGNFNMLVGDAKQAIYRFRNGEVELFVHLPGIYQNDGSTLQLDRERQLKESHVEKVIKENYRSREEIIHFNNDFFKVLKGGFSERLSKIYEQHNQGVPKKSGGKNKDGFVSIEFTESENADDYSIKRLEKIKAYVERLLASGYNQRDICVLTRTNNDSSEVATSLIEEGFKVVSPESLLLSNSPKVRFIASLIKLFTLPNDPIIQTEVLRNHLEIDGKTENLNDYFLLGKEAAVLGMNHLFEFLMLNIDSNELQYYPVYEIAEALVRELNPESKTDVYLQYFLDFVFAAQNVGISNPLQFTELWGDKKEKAYITLPEGEDAITVMTVHKAKGLKFNVVIVDIMDRSNKKGKKELWTELELPELGSLSVGLIPIISDLKKAGKESYYKEEEDKTKLDFINMVYVAFTRPVDALFILGDKNIKGRKERFSGLLIEYLIGSMKYDESTLLYELGVLAAIKQNPQPDDAGIVLKKMVSEDWADKVTVAKADEVYWEALNNKSARTYGKLIHAILSGIKTAKDLPVIIEKYQLNGIINKTESIEIAGILNKVIHHPLLVDDYSEGIIIKNESELIEKSKTDTMFQRPDRVVINGEKLTIIDYKTGEKESRHLKQIEHYSSLFKSLGFEQIERKLVYINSDIEVLEV